MVTALEVQNKHDIGYYILTLKDSSNKIVPDAVKIAIFGLTNSEKDFKFPAKNVGAKMLKFQSTWTEKWKWLIYSKHFDAHQADSTLSVISQLDSNRKKQILENREAIKPIVKTVIFCGQNEIPLRGDDESSDLSKTLDAQSCRDGKFRALLRFSVESGDSKLKEHLENAKENAMYTSPKIVNEIIDICDETLDVSGIEQFSLCVRYVDIKNVVVKDDFLCYVPLTEMTVDDVLNEMSLKQRRLNLTL
ncbi:hypothetical protein ACJJTC_014280 [Scirpophaga incertulas]